MLDAIKSTYFIRQIFFFLTTYAKLELIKYNKNLQNICNINIINYKFASGKYIIEEKNGKVKEYEGNTDNLIYEGEYLKGKRNGKGKEYDNWGELKFEGEYLKGKRNGEGKEYYFRGFFEG